jgi:hypothetical protein
MFLELSDDEKLELIELLTGTILEEHHEPSPRASVLQAILDKLEAEDAITAPLSADGRRLAHASASQWKQEVAAEERQIVAHQQTEARNATSRLVVLAGCIVLLVGLALLLYVRR